MPRECVLAVLTCPRSTSYVTETLRQIDTEGGSNCARFLFVDGEVDPFYCPPGWHTVGLAGKRLGSAEALRSLLWRLAPFDCDVIAFEDDVELCKNAVAQMLAVEVPEDCAFVSFFDMKEVPQFAKCGLYRRHAENRDTRGFWGNQSLRIPSDMVAWLASQDWTSTRFGAARNSGDTVLGELIQRHPTRQSFAVHVPCLVEHVGAESACAPGSNLTRRRRATNYPGKSFDALSLGAVNNGAFC